MEDQKKAVSRVRVSERDKAILARVETRKARGERDPLEYEGRLHFTHVELDKKNFHYYIENDKDHAINLLIDIGYEPVLDETGQVVRVNADKNTGMDGILMRLPMDKFKKLQAAREIENKEQEQRIKKKPVSGASIGTETYEVYDDIQPKG